MTKITPAVLKAIKPKRDRGTICLSIGDGLQARYGARGRVEFSLVYRVADDPHQNRNHLGYFWNDDMGPAPSDRWITLDQAKRMALEIRERAARGSYEDLDWRAPRRRPEAPEKTADSVEAAIDRYAREHLGTLRTGAAVEKRLRQSLAGFLSRPISQVDGLELAEVTDAVMRKGLGKNAKGEVAGYMANRVHADLSGFFRWAADPRRRLVQLNPMLGMARPMRQEHERERVLSDDEFAAIWSAADRWIPARRDALRLLMLTGARLEEVAGMPWKEVDLEAGAWLLPKERSKTKTERLVFLSPLALQVIGARDATSRRDNVFDFGGNKRSDLSGYMAKLTRALKIPDARLHDVRRTVATGMQKLGIAEHVIDRCCGWSPLKGAKRRYQRYEYVAERTAAMLAWSDHVEKITGEC
jgi:integrase